LLCRALMSALPCPVIIAELIQAPKFIASSTSSSTNRNRLLNIITARRTAQKRSRQKTDKGGTAGLIIIEQAVVIRTVSVNTASTLTPMPQACAHAPPQEREGICQPSRLMKRRLRW
jgi:hypothetical protein